MSATADLVKVQQFQRNVRHLAQQGIARLRPWVYEVSGGGEAHNFDRMAAGEATAKTTRKTPTPDDETAWSRRQSVPTPIHKGDVYEKADVNQMLADPGSNYVKAHGMAMKRGIDDKIIAAATGTSRDGAGNSIAFPAGQVVGDGTASISFDIVTEVGELFADNDIDPDEPKVFVISPRQQRKLLQLTEATSNDYNLMNSLRGGYVDSWMGFSWVVSSRLLAPDTGEIDCFAMTRNAIGLQMNQDATVEVAKDPSISFAWRVYTYLEAGAVRVEDEQLVRVHLSQTI